MDVIEQAQRDLANGDVEMARDRLFEALGRQPASQPILDLLAYTHLMLGDRAAAGAAWFLTDKSDDDPTAASAFAALEARHGSVLGLARSLPINAASDRYPVRAQRRLERLAAAALANGQVWVPPKDTVYFDELGVDSDNFVDDDFRDAGTGSTRPFRQRVLASLIIVAIAATSASVVLAIIFS